jgi:hypothetical protein
MVEDPRCADCGVHAPKTTTAHTLISREHAWRLIRRSVADGVVAEWRCPRCWQRFKASRENVA